MHRSLLGILITVSFMTTTHGSVLAVQGGNSLVAGLAGTWMITVDQVPHERYELSLKRGDAIQLTQTGRWSYTGDCAARDSSCIVRTGRWRSLVDDHTHTFRLFVSKGQSVSGNVEIDYRRELKNGRDFARDVSGYVNFNYQRIHLEWSEAYPVGSRKPKITDGWNDIPVSIDLVRAK